MPSFSALRMSAGSSTFQRSASSAAETISGVASSSAKGSRRARVEHLGARAVGALDQPADRLEVEAVGLELLDQLDAGDVLGAVEAGATAHLRRGEEAPGLVGADVPHGHPDALGELVDRQIGRGLLLSDLAPRINLTTFDVS